MRRRGREQATVMERFWAILPKVWSALKDFLYGFFLHGMVQEVAARKRRHEELFFLVLLGDLVGVPISSGYYRLRLLPHCISKLEAWKRRICIPKDLFYHIKE